MAIEFTCPNGHKLSSPPDHAGRLAKCPRCGAISRVPETNGAARVTGVELATVGEAAGKSSKPSLDRGANVEMPGTAVDSLVTSGDSNRTLTDPPASAPSDGDPNATTPPAGVPASDKPLAEPSAQSPIAAPVEEPIIFLCPNGHKLNAPRRMQGRPGQCPHCGAKFHIPLIDEGAGGETDNEDLSAFEELLEPGAAAPPATGDAFDLTSATAEPKRAEDLEFWGPEQHTLARLVTRLWSEREHGGIIELHLTGGAMIVPDWFERRLSQDTHGLFATQAADGTVTMTIVPWDSVSRVVVRGVVGLPDGMFE